MFRKYYLLLDNLVNRDKYHESLAQRIEHFKDIQSSPSKRAIDEPVDATDRDTFIVPEIDSSELTLAFLKKSMREQGCCLVRNHFNASDVSEMKSFIDHSFTVHQNPDTTINKFLRKPVDLEQVLIKTRKDIAQKQKGNSTYTNTVRLGKQLNQPLGKVGASLSVLAAKTPIVTEKLLGVYERKGMKSLLTDYFENEPCVSVYKWALRVVSTERAGDFHQDGAFMGEDIDSLNCWIPLSDCGPGFNAPGLDIVPKRFMQSFGKGSGMLDWTISADAVAELDREKAVVSPAFRSGDALFFDHLLVHRPQYDPAHTQKRYAIETWFFDSKNFPKNQIPIKW